MKKLSLILTIFILSTMFTFSAYASGDITIVSPGTSCTTDLSEIAVECEGATKIIFELDGVKIGETAGETVLPLEDGTITAGNHRLKVSAIFADKTATQTELSFNAQKLLTLKESKQDFNTYEAGSHSAVGIAMVPQTGKFSSGDTAAIEPDTGKSGEEGDKSLKFYYLVNNWVSSNIPYFNYTGFTNYGAKGIVTFKFDLKLSDSSRSTIRMMDMPHINGQLNFIDYGKVKNTDVAIESNKWTNVQLIHNYSENNTVVLIDGVEAYNGTAGSNNYYKNNETEFTPMQLKSIPENNTDPSLRLAYWFDNFDFKQQLAYGLDSLLYAKDESWTSCGSEKIPADASKLKLVLTEALDASTVNTDTVSVYENGAKLTLSDVTYDSTEKSIVVTPSQSFAKGSEIVVKLADTVKLSGGQTSGVALEARTSTESASLTPSSVTFKKNDSLLISSAQLEAGDIVSADVTLNNDSDETKDMSVIVYVRQNKRLRAIGAVEAKLDPQSTKPVTVTLPAISDLDSEGDVSVKLAVCDTLETALPYIAYTEIK